MKDFNVRITFI